MQLHERFLAINDLMQRGVALDAKLMPLRVRLRYVSLSDARAWQATYTTWVADCLPLLDSDLQRLFTAAHSGTDDQRGTERLLELVVQACDPDPAIAEPATAAIHPQFWYVPFGNPLGRHLEILETARRRAFPATHAIPPELKEIIAASQKRHLNGSIDQLFVTSGCEPHGWVRPLERYPLQSAQRVHGWLTAIQVHAPAREIAIVQTVTQAVLRTAHLSVATRDALQQHLDALQPSAPPRPVPKCPSVLVPTRRPRFRALSATAVGTRRSPSGCTRTFRPTACGAGMRRMI